MRRSGASAATRGFTLVELLISLLLFALVLSAAVAINIGTSRSAAGLQARNDLLPETQIAQNYMISKVQQAAYLFPSGSSITMNSSSVTTQNLSGGAAWTVGTDPIVAFFLPPKQDSNTLTCTAATPDYCYTFYAYYPVKRSVLVAGTSGAANPGADPVNDSSEWVLMEYRATYPLTGYPSGATSLDATLQGGTGHLVMDYLRPPASSETLFSQSASTTVVGQTSVSINLAAQRTVAGQTLNIPASSRFSVTVYPRNVGKTAISN